MKFTQALALLALATHISASAIPEANADAKNTFHILPIDERSPDSSSIFSPDHTLEKRKGGGGRGGGGGGGGSGGRTGGGSGGGSGGSSRTSGTSNVGGATRAGSGPPRAFGGGGYYGGGAAQPYRSGGRTPKGLIAGAIIAPVALLALMPGLWLYSAYPYYYNNPYRFYNRSATEEDNNNDNNNNARRSNSLWTRQNAGRNETLPVICLCGENLVCGCDENDDQSYITDLIGDGSYAGLNKSLITVSDVNGTKTLILNGTLPNGTTAPGGTDDEGAAGHLAAGRYAGYWAMVLIVVYGVFM